MKKLVTLSVAMMASTSAFAGNIAYVAPEVTMIDEAPRAGSGAWLIPLVIIAILALVLTQDQPSPSRG